MAQASQQLEETLKEYDMYHSQVSVKESKLEQAQITAFTYAEEMNRQFFRDKIIPRAIGGLKLSALERKLCKLAEVGLFAEPEDVDRDIDSAPLGPNAPELTSDKHVLADAIARHLLGGRVTVIKEQHKG